MPCMPISTTSSASSAKLNTFIFDLQLFSQEKTEEATPKRKEEARKKGQVAKSVELNSAFIILASFFALKVAGSYIYEELSVFMRYTFANLAIEDFTVTAMQNLLATVTITFFKINLPIMAVIVLISLAVNFLQVGFHLSTEALMPNFERINPLSGFQRLFSKHSLVELIKALFKITIVGYFIYHFIERETQTMPTLMQYDLTDAIHIIAGLTLSLAFQIGGVLLVLAGLDYYYQWWEHNQSLKMSKQEIKEEMKQTEGNPQIKGKIRERQRAMAMRRMMQEIPKADVVVTNPTHFAVALKYEQGMVAPQIVAKGQDFIAQRIKEIAREHRVMIVENKPLARALYSTVQVGDTVPAELYQAVAEVLAYVYRLKKRLS